MRFRSYIVGMLNSLGRGCDDPDGAGLLPGPRAYDRTLLGQIDRRLFGTSAARYIIFGIIGLSLTVPSIQFVIRINEVHSAPFRETGESRRTALGRWLPTARLVHFGEMERDPYGYGHWFPLPPFVLLALAPLAQLGFLGAGIAWAFFKIVGISIALYTTLKSMRVQDFAVPTGVLLMGALFGLRPIIADIQHGNVNTFVFIWVALAWAAYVNHRDYSAGVFLALAVVTKITPALLLVYFAYKREWRVCTAAAVGLLLAFVFVPGVWFGFAENWELHRAWFEMLVAPFLLHGYATINEFNQSLYGVLLRVGESVGVLQLERMHIDDALLAGNDVMARPLGAAAYLKPAISLSFLLALAWLCRSSARSRRDPRRLLEFAVVLIAMLLLGERTWKHHATTLLIVYLALWHSVACLPWTDRVRALLAGGLFLQWLLLMATSEGFLGDAFADRAMFAGAFCWGLVLAFVETGIILWLIGRPTGRGAEWTGARPRP